MEGILKINGRLLKRNGSVVKYKDPIIPNLSFTVGDQYSRLVEGATIDIGGGYSTQNTNISGQTTFVGVVPNTYNYSITKNDYTTYNDSVVVSNNNVTEVVTLNAEEWIYNPSIPGLGRTKAELLAEGWSENGDNVGPSSSYSFSESGGIFIDANCAINGDYATLTVSFNHQLAGKTLYIWFNAYNSDQGGFGEWAIKDGNSTILGDSFDGSTSQNDYQVVLSNNTLNFVTEAYDGWGANINISRLEIY
jgi:hypothetical protein